MTAKTPQERKAAERKRNKKAGLVIVQAWCHPEDRPKIREYAEKLANKRKESQCSTKNK